VLGNNDIRLPAGTTARIRKAHKRLTLYTIVQSELLLLPRTRRARRKPFGRPLRAWGLVIGSTVIGLSFLVENSWFSRNFHPLLLNSGRPLLYHSLVPSVSPNISFGSPPLPSRPGSFKTLYFSPRWWFIVRTPSSGFPPGVNARNKLSMTPPGGSCCAEAAFSGWGSLLVYFSFLGGRISQQSRRQTKYPMYSLPPLRLDCLLVDLVHVAFKSERGWCVVSGG